MSDDAMAATMHCKNLVSESAILEIPSFVLLCLVALQEEAGDATEEEEKRDLCLCTLQNASCWDVDCCNPFWLQHAK